jgi:hypothetical protein
VSELTAKVERRGRSREHWLVLGLSALAPIGLLVMRAFLVASPEGHGTHQQLGLPSCMLMERFGFPCPGCGVTTAVTHAAQGHWMQSLLAQPFGLVIAVAAMLALPVALVAHLGGADLYRLLERLNRRPAWYALIALVVGAWLYKIVVTFAAA